jgi:hypothetical protein
MRAQLAKVFRVVGRILVPAIVGLIGVLPGVHFLWKASGSNEWKLVRDENGIQVFTLKAPGSTLLQCRARMRVKTSLASSVFLLRGDPATNDDFGGTDFKVIERIETPDVYLAYYSVKHKMPPPFSTKELVILLNYSQDKQTKAVEINVQAAPTKTPPTAGASRVTHLNNIFRLTPLPNGEVEWDITGDVDMGLFYPLANLAMPDFVFKDLSRDRQLVQTQRYQKASLISVQEL